MIRVALPFHLRNLAKAGKEVQLHVEEPVTQQAILDALEAAYPMLRGTVRDHQTHKRRDFIRFFAAGQDWSHNAPDAPLIFDVVPIIDEATPAILGNGSSASTLRCMTGSAWAPKAPEHRANASQRLRV